LPRQHRVARDRPRQRDRRPAPPVARPPDHRAFDYDRVSTMTKLTTVVADSAPNHGFFAPTFQLHIDGAGLPRDVLRDVTELSYHDSVEKIDNFQITVNNWDADKKRCKYIGSETAKDLKANDDKSLLFKLFEPCSKKVVLSMGYVGNPLPMITAHF